MDKWGCNACEYVYDPAEGDDTAGNHKVKCLKLQRPMIHSGTLSPTHRRQPMQLFLFLVPKRSGFIT